MSQMTVSISKLTFSRALYQALRQSSEMPISASAFATSLGRATMLLVQLNAKMRRYVFFRTKMLGYSTQEWGKLHALVTDDSMRELFWMLLRSRNVSHIREGTALENDFMATAVAQSAPEAIGYLKHLCLAALEDLQPRDGQGLYANSSAHVVASHPDALVLKERSADVPDSMRNLLGPALEDALLEKDFALSHNRRNASATAVNS